MKNQTQRDAQDSRTKLVGGATVDLPPISFEVPDTLIELLSESSASSAGYSAVSKWLTCPEQSRLSSLGLKRKGYSGGGAVGRLSALHMGVLMHALRAYRIVHGHEAMEIVLRRWEREMDEEDFMKTFTMFRTYESLYPRAADPLEYLGIEAEVRTDLRSAQEVWDNAPPVVRTVRYDTVVRSGGSLFSFEAKSMSRSGASSLEPYIPQAYAQVAIWNANAALVAKYGRMDGVLWDCLIKTNTPNVDRVGPRYVSRTHQKLALDYLRLPETGGVVYRANPDGTYPRMLHACWGRWRACEYLDLCHDDAFGEYEFSDGRTYGGQ